MKMDQTCESICGSPVGVYGGFYAIRRELAVPQPAGMILDDMFQPLSIIARATGQSLIRMPTSTTSGLRKLDRSFIAKCARWRGISSSSVSRCGRLLHGIQFSFSLSRTRSCVSCALPFGSVAYLRIGAFERITYLRCICSSSDFGWASLSLACVTGFPCCIVSRRQPARCSYSKRPPLSDFTNLSSHVARFGRYGLS